MAEVFTISALERRSGVPRSTIHFYVREGLLPSAQKTAAGRSLYSEEHLVLLRRVGELKEAGHALAEIRGALAPDLEKARENSRDLAREENERVRRLILRVATEEFETSGYEKTHVSTIIRKAGITRQLLYAHFTSKLELLVESFRLFVTWNVAFNESRIADTPDLGERVLSRLAADEQASHLATDVLSHIRAERGHSADERRRLAERAWESVARVVTTELEGLRRADGPPAAVPLELLAYSMLGAHHNAAMRASWDEQWTREDVFRTHLWIWLVVTAALSGAIDVDSKLAGYERLVRQLSSRPPEAPPALED
jgi:DNA-binding transcriptional MerR regulator